MMATTACATMTMTTTTVPSPSVSLSAQGSYAMDTSVPPSFRLLYRGALSLPDSLLLLDGLTFAARLDSPSKQNTFHLLENPLALALESMRGRPTLKMLGVVNMKDVYLDESGRVEMDIHPFALLSRIYFENTFCLLPFSTASSSQNPLPDRSEIGIQVALGDSNGPETTEIVIFAQCEPSTNTIRLHVGRVTQRPLQPQARPRAPRPDDPIPRKPPAFFIRDLKRTGSINDRDLKRIASSNNVGIGPLKRQKTVADLGSGVRLEDTIFKVPELPNQGKGKGKERDVFGDVSEVGRVTTTLKKVDDGLEKANKNVIKRSTIEYLGRTKDPTDATRCFDKGHPEFKDLYGFIYRGVGFALRANIQTDEVELNLVNRLIDKHARMYLPRQ